MILSAKVKLPDGSTINAPFLVRFAHTPAMKNGEPVKTRICEATVYTMTATAANEASEKFSSRAVGDKFVTPIAKGKSICHISKGESYCRAFARQNALEKALRAAINPEKYMNGNGMLSPAASGCPYKFTAETFNDFIKVLRHDNPHGVKAADELRKKFNAETAMENEIEKGKKWAKAVKAVGEALIAANPTAQQLIKDLVAKM